MDHDESVGPFRDILTAVCVGIAAIITASGTIIAGWFGYRIKKASSDAEAKIAQQKADAETAVRTAEAEALEQKNKDAETARNVGQYRVTITDLKSDMVEMKADFRKRLGTMERLIADLQNQHTECRIENAELRNQNAELRNQNAEMSKRLSLLEQRSQGKPS